MEVVAITNSQLIKMALGYKKMSEAALARELGLSPQTLHQRMKTDKFTNLEMVRIGEILGAKYYSAYEFPDGTKVQ